MLAIFCTEMGLVHLGLFAKMASTWCQKVIFVKQSFFSDIAKNDEIFGGTLVVRQCEEAHFIFVHHKIGGIITVQQLLKKP